jgi:hypothetical protein
MDAYAAAASIGTAWLARRASRLIAVGRLFPPPPRAEIAARAAVDDACVVSRPSRLDRNVTRPLASFTVTWSRRTLHPRRSNGAGITARRRRRSRGTVDPEAAAAAS